VHVSTEALWPHLLALLSGWHYRKLYIEISKRAARRSNPLVVRRLLRFARNDRSGGLPWAGEWPPFFRRTRAYRDCVGERSCFLGGITGAVFLPRAFATRVCYGDNASDFDVRPALRRRAFLIAEGRPGWIESRRARPDCADSSAHVRLFFPGHLQQIQAVLPAFDETKIPSASSWGTRPVAASG
jgi:hypothetical protein